MKRKCFQACYAHPDTGWTITNTSADMPRGLLDDFLSTERANAGMAAGEKVPMGENETPFCMLEIYCRNDAAWLVRTQYGLSDVQGRPISFSHGYLFLEAYELLKEPNDLLRIKRENFADKRVSEEERTEISSMPGAVNQELIKASALDKMPETFLLSEPYSYKNALKVCHLSEEAFRTYMVAVYAHILSGNADKNLYIKTDGSERYAWNLLYLTYLALPYSMRILLSASTYVHVKQHNAKLIFGYELPNDVPQIDPVTGANNVMNETVERRTRERNPFITASLDYVACGKQDLLFKSIETCLKWMGDDRLSTISVMNLAYAMCRKEYDIPERLPGLVYSWLALSVCNTKNWEKIVCLLLKKAEQYDARLGEEVEKILRTRLEEAITEDFKTQGERYLASSDERK